jgi:hypothetical protein
MAEEKGLQFTEDFFKSERFEKLLDKMKYMAEVSGYDPPLPGLFDEIADGLANLCVREYGGCPPQGYLAFLKIMNGYTYNDQSVYGFDYEGDLLDSWGNIFKSNDAFSDYKGCGILFGKDRKRRLLLVGESNENFYCYDRTTGDYSRYDWAFDLAYETFGSFAEMFSKMMIKAFDDDEIRAMFPEYADKGEAHNGR